MTIFDLTFDLCDHTDEYGYRDCSTLPTHVVTLQTPFLEPTWSASCADHVRSTINEGLRIASLLSFPASVSNFVISGVDRHIHPGLSFSCALEVM